MDAVVVGLAELQLTFPAFLVALVLNGAAALVVPPDLREPTMLPLLIIALGLADWPRYAVLLRGLARAEWRRPYIDAARAVGVPPIRMIMCHLLPNVVRPALSMAAVGLALAVTAEATLSYLGLGVSPTSPSLGTQIRHGQAFMLSGEWWTVFFPSLALVALVLVINRLPGLNHEPLDFPGR